MNHNRTPHYTMPVPPEGHSADMPFYRAFVSEMGRATGQTVAEQLRTAMAAAAARTGTSADHIARILVDHGLRAPRDAFPHSFIGYVDTMSQKQRVGALFAADSDMTALAHYWQTAPQTPAAKPAKLAQRVLENA